MLELIAMWGGIAGIIVAFFAIIFLYLTRKNILDILDKDAILLDKNFEIKNKVIQSALAIVDELFAKGPNILYATEFNARAKACYNAMLCTISDMQLIEEFRILTLDNSTELTEFRIIDFKLNCRKDIGLITKKSNLTKSSINKDEYNTTNIKTNSVKASNLSNLQSQTMSQHQNAIKDIQQSQTITNSQSSNSMHERQLQQKSTQNQNQSQQSQSAIAIQRPSNYQTSVNKPN